MLAGLLATVICFLPRHSAAEDSDQKAIEDGKEALSRVGRLPWYNKNRDEARPLHVVPRERVANRGSKWTADPTTAATGRTWRGNFFGPVLQWLGITVLIVLLGMIAYFIATAFLEEEVSETTTTKKLVESRRDADRVEALPFHVRAASGDFLAEARRLYEAARYSEAVVYLFSYELVQLDKHHVIRLTKGKTNRQYLRETRHRPALRAVLEVTMVAFEEAFFGRKSLSKERFERCWEQLDTFEKELAHEERAAA